MKTICVLVLYNPNLKLLDCVIDSIIEQVSLLWISDNSPSSKISQKYFGKFRNKVLYQSMGSNIGIASAQNAGVNYAIEQNYDFLFYIDQDSISPLNIIENLLSEYLTLRNTGVKIGAIGPRPVNRQSDKEYRGSVKKGVVINKDITEVTELISSASLTEVKTFKRVGLMDEILFIDGVDHEWCWRAEKIGQYRFFIAENCKLSHQLGEGDRHFLLKKIAIPSPFRVYYQFRNYFWLVRRDYVPLYWKLSNGFKFSIKFFYYPIFLSPHKLYFKNVMRGIKDGLLNK